jgi:hypothetical protein
LYEQNDTYQAMVKINQVLTRSCNDFANFFPVVEAERNKVDQHLASAFGCPKAPPTLFFNIVSRKYVIQKFHRKWRSAYVLCGLHEKDKTIIRRQ